MSIPITEADREKMRLDDYEKEALGIFGWQDSAEKLKRAADIALQAFLTTKSGPGIKTFAEGSRDWEKSSDSRLIDVYYMLIGLSIENWVKAIIVRYLPANLTIEEKLEKIRKHETNELLDAYDSMHEFNADHGLLKKLVEYVKWKGKYPVPTKKEDYNQNHIVGQIDDINNLYNKLYKRQRRERRLDILKTEGALTKDKSLKDFLDMEEEVVEFYNKDPDKKISKIIDAYGYPWPVVKHALEDHNEDLNGEDKKKLWLKIEIFDLRKED